MAESPDALVLQYAKQQGFVIVTKDRRIPKHASLGFSLPPIVLVRTGNCSTARVHALIRREAIRIEHFAKYSHVPILTLF